MPLFQGQQKPSTKETEKDSVFKVLQHYDSVQRNVAPVLTYMPATCFSQGISNVCKTTLYLQVFKHPKIMRSDCPLNFGLEVFGDKWSLLIIRDLLLFGKRNYGEFLASKEGISTNILADRLTHLEREGLITREKDAEHRRKKIYKPTQKGMDLMPILLEIGLWSKRYGNEACRSNMEAILTKIANDN
jgi:DNA-binding HxlR family transcriptional regulator